MTNKTICDACGREIEKSVDTIKIEFYLDPVKMDWKEHLDVHRTRDCLDKATKIISGILSSPEYAWWEELA